MAAAADVFARRFFEILQRSTGISARLALAENKKAPKQALGGPRVTGAGPNSRQSSSAAARGQVSSKPHLNAADCKSLERPCLLNFVQCWIFSRDDPVRETDRADPNKVVSSD